MGISMVTGANGHLGNNLVRALLNAGETVRAGIRNMENQTTLASLDCEVVHCDFLDQTTLDRSLEGVETLYQVAAVFKHWAADEEKEIVMPNVVGTRAILEAAHRAGVQKIVYVSSIAALESSQRNEKGDILTYGYNTSDQENPYVRSKTLSEMEAWKVADELDLNLVTVLPSTIIGGDYKKMTETLMAFSAIVNSKMPYAYPMYLNLIDANDVAQGMIQAAKYGKKGCRYVLCNKKTFSFEEIVEVAKLYNPSLNPPKILDEKTIYEMADKAEAEARTTGTRPRLIKSNIKRTFNVAFNFDLTQTIRDLNFDPLPGALILKETFKTLYEK